MVLSQMSASVCLPVLGLTSSQALHLTQGHSEQECMPRSSEPPRQLCGSRATSPSLVLGLHPSSRHPARQARPQPCTPGPAARDTPATRSVAGMTWRPPEHGRKAHPCPVAQGGGGPPPCLASVHPDTRSPRTTPLGLDSSQNNGSWESCLVDPNMPAEAGMWSMPSAALGSSLFQVQTNLDPHMDRLW